MSLFAIPSIGICSPNPVLLPMVTLITVTSGQSKRCLEYLCKMLSLPFFTCPLMTLYSLCWSTETDPQSCWSEQQLNLVQEVCFYLLPTEIRNHSAEYSPVLAWKPELAILWLSQRKDGGRILLFMNMFISIWKIGIFCHKFFPSL